MPQNRKIMSQINIFCALYSLFIIYIVMVLYDKSRIGITESRLVFSLTTIARRLYNFRMKEFFAKIKSDGALKTIKRALASKYYPFVTAAVALFCYYLGLDVVIIYFIGITSILMLLLLDDLTPLISNFLFMNVMVSPQHAPATDAVENYNSYYFFHPAVLSFVIIIIVLMVAAIIFRIVMTIKKGNFKLTPTFFGLCAFAAVMILGGLFSKGYDPMNLVFGAVMAALFLGIFSLMKDNLKISKENYEKIAYAFVALSALVIIELAVVYISKFNEIFSDGVISRGPLIGFGWGTYNQVGMLLLISIPAIFYLAGKNERGYLFFLYSVVVLFAAFMSMSRQAMLGSVVIYPLCLIILLIKGKNRMINAIITSVAAVCIIVLMGVFWNKLSELFSNIFNNLFSGSGRTKIWKEGIGEFVSAPFLGTGWYTDLADKFEGLGKVGFSFIPEMYHDTFVQLLASCGIMGLAAYLVHRVQTVISFCKNVTLERTFIGVCVLALLIVNLFDNHLFYLFPTMVYASLIALLIKSEKKEEPEKN